MKKSIKQRISDLNEIADKYNERDVAFCHFKEALSVIETQRKDLTKALELLDRTIEIAKELKNNKRQEIKAN